MKINNLEKMERIVSRNKNLSWIGWDVVDRKRSESGRTSTSGVRVNGEWFLQRIYSVSRDGWNIPDKYRG
jgi:GTP cyclohydrolase FolE2